MSKNFINGHYVEDAEIIKIEGVSAPAVSKPDEAVLYFDETLNKTMISENGGAFTYLTGGAGGADQTPWTSDIDADGYNLTDVDLLYANYIATILNGTITRSGNYISSIALTGGPTLTITRSGNYISSVTDGTKTWTFTRNGSNQIISWSVT